MLPPYPNFGMYLQLVMLPVESVMMRISYSESADATANAAEEAMVECGVNTPASLPK